jgi:poly-gamma-glutamate synthesis protein (capsule biosynthesis protein)
MDGQRIAVIGATLVLDDNLIDAWTATPTHAGLASAKRTDRLLQEVRAARETADTVVVFLHYGIEGQTCPEPRQTTIAGQLVDAGADIVVGGHSHRLQGAGRMGNALVAYGLGNFLFYARPGPGAESGVLLVTVTGRDIDSYEWVPARIRGGTPQPLDGAEKEAAVAAWHGLRDCTGLRP